METDECESKVWQVFLVLAILSLAFLGSPAAAADPDPPGKKAYQVFGFNDLGMHCYDNDYSVFSLLPPFNTIHSQVIAKGLRPKLLTGAQVAVTYSAILDPNHSINSTSAGKTNFWQYIYQLFGLTRPVDVGILGYKMPGSGSQPLSFENQPWKDDPTLKWFSATGIPITNIDDAGNINCFPMMQISASDTASTQPSSLDIVLPTSSEMNCSACHESAAFVDSNPGSASDASPPPRLTTLTADDFSNNPNSNIRFRENILILHDALSGTNLFKQYKPDDPNQAGNPVLCAQCHYSKALDLAENNRPTGDQVGHLYLSRAMHKHHGTAWPVGTGMGGGMGGGMASSGYLTPIPGTGAQQCYYCHPGNDTQCLRSVMAINGMQCQSCHGGLLAVAGFTPQLALPHGVDRLPTDPALLTVALKTTGEQRRPWVDMPKCQSCHTGDAVNHLGPTIVGRQAYTNPNSDTASPILAPNSRFAENNRLYRFSQTHGGVACESCHGSTHAEWPSRADGNDNLTPQQIQGYAAEIAECGSCHLPGLEPGLTGPHGLHSINDPTWSGTAHGTIYKQNGNACKACHGLDLRGTVLSRVKADRTLAQSVLFGGGTINFAKGTEISCYACHRAVQ